MAPATDLGDNVRDNVTGAVWRFSIFTGVCLLAAFAMIAVFGQLRFGSQRTYNAEFSNVSGLESGNFVRIAGVEVGKVKHISINNNTAVVEFSTDNSVVLTEGTHAVVRYDNLIGGRYLALEEGTGGVRVIRPGDTIPLDRTAPALDLDALIGGFRPLFTALNPDQVNALTGELIHAFQGEGGTVTALLQQTAAFTGTLAARDELIGQVITNLDTVLSSLGEQSKQFDKGVTSLSDLVKGLASRKEDIGNALAHINGAAATFADLLVQARAPLHELVHETDRSSGLIVSDHDYINNLLDTLPDAYRTLSRLGLYGDFFNFYGCEVLFKFNGKGGQPVYARVSNQTTGRCAPK